MVLYKLEQLYLLCHRVGGMVFNAAFSNISAISWRSVLLVEQSGVPGENQRPAASHYVIGVVVLSKYIVKIV